MLKTNSNKTKRINDVMVNVLASNVVDRGFDSDRVKPMTIKLFLLLLFYVRSFREKEQRLVGSESE